MSSRERELMQRMEDHVRTQLWSRGARGLVVRIRRSVVAGNPDPYYVRLTTSTGRRTVEIDGADCDRLISGIFHAVNETEVVELASKLESAVIG